MEAIYKLKANEISPELMDVIQKLFKDKEITITISSEPDETTYLTINPANEKHLMESMAEKPSVRFTLDEFNEVIKKL
jgi:hypothetical protein